MQNNNNPFRRKWQGPVHPGLHVKHRPMVAGGGESLPLEILRCLSEWASVLEDRGTVPGKFSSPPRAHSFRSFSLTVKFAGTSLGSIIGSIAAFEESLTGTSFSSSLDSLCPHCYM